MPTSSVSREPPTPSPAAGHLIEYHRRLALPTACIVLALVGIPLGLSSKKGGKSSGFVLTILLVFLYYSISLIGVSFAKQGRLSPAAGVWLADLVFLAGGIFLLWRSERRPIELAALRACFRASWFKASTLQIFHARPAGAIAARERRRPARPLANVEFPVCPRAGTGSISVSQPSSTIMCCAILRSTSP